MNDEYEYTRGDLHLYWDGDDCVVETGDSSYQLECSEVEELASFLLARMSRSELRIVLANAGYTNLGYNPYF